MELETERVAVAAAVVSAKIAAAEATLVGLRAELALLVPAEPGKVPRGQRSQTKKG